MSNKRYTMVDGFKVLDNNTGTELDFKRVVQCLNNADELIEDLLKHIEDKRQGEVAQ